MSQKHARAMVTLKCSVSMAIERALGNFLRSRR